MSEFKSFTRTEAAAELRRLADILSDASARWTDTEIRDVGHVARLCNEYQFREALTDGQAAMTRAAFEAMSAARKMSFIRGGGRILD